MAIPTLTMIPSGYKAGKLYSALPTNGDGDFTTTRSSSATRVNKSGLIETVASNVPRLDYSDSSCPSLLLESSATNLLKYSEDLSNSAWLKSSGVTVVSNNEISPNGGLNADKAIPSTGGTFIELYQLASVTAGNEYTQTYFVKYAGLRYIQIIAPGTLGTFYVNFDLVDGVVSSSSNGNAIGLQYSIEEYAYGFYRIRVTTQALSTTTAGRLAINFIKTATTSRGVNEGNFNGVDGVLIWGAQFEQNSLPTSYIPTTTASVTRADERSVKSGLSDYLNGTEGVIYADIAFNATKSTNTFNSISLQDSVGDSQNLIGIFQPTTDNFLKVYMRQANATLINLQYPINATSFNKIALWYKSGDTKLFINGVLTATITSAFTPFSLTQINYIFDNDPNYKLKDFRVYGSDLITDSFLTELTTI
ncbi:hypothetical protein N9931_00395 [bacterium]|nr:hypothetical protein [bacterium]